YGQTGSGKTFTMQGPPQPTEKTTGMIPRAVHQIYDVTQQLKQFGWEYTMEGQFLEIYNESIHDLLGDVSNFGKIKHDIRHEKNGKTTVTDMTTVRLDSPSRVKQMLKRASQNRATGATNLNERSSRSHSVFTLQLTGENTRTGERSSGLLNLIDLAGSERLSMSGSVGDRLKETQAINKSLSSLGDVIHSLVNKKEGSHIPYRNSKLTWLLRNSLGGNCKTLMFVNVSPLVDHLNETLCSLRFATKVNSCQVGTVKKISGK
ncbi:kinesin-like nuclear fusion protein, partial [Rhizopus stolonifer]